MKKFSERSNVEKAFIFLIIILIIGIILRWSFIKKEAKRGFEYYGTKSDTTQITK